MLIVVFQLWLYNNLMEHGYRFSSLFYCIWSCYTYSGVPTTLWNNGPCILIHISAHDPVMEIVNQHYTLYRYNCYWNGGDLDIQQTDGSWVQDYISISCYSGNWVCLWYNKLRHVFKYVFCDGTKKLTLWYWKNIYRVVQKKVYDVI